MELGKIDIYFGTIHSVEDPQKLLRCQIQIPGFTDKLDADSLPWYWCWNGINYLPEKNDVVPVIIFDKNFTTAFYGAKINVQDQVNTEAELDSDNIDEYKNYLELFKRKVNDKQIQLTYRIKSGIEIINGETKTQTELEKYTIFCKANTIEVTENKINLGNQGLEPAILGDKCVKELHDIIKHQANIISQMYTGFQKIIAGCTSPFTAPIAAQLGPHMPTQATLKSENSKIDSNVDPLKSEMVFINK